MADFLSLAAKQDMVGALLDNAFPKRAVLLRQSYEVSNTHRTLSDIPEADRSSIQEVVDFRVTPNESNNSVTVSGSSFTQANGNPFPADPGNFGRAVWIFIDTGDESTSRLLRYGDIDLLSLETPVEIRLPSAVVFVLAG